MNNRSLLFYISGHGFGHATRDTEVINQIARTRPDLRIVVRSAVSRTFLQQSIHGPFDLRPAEIDTGMVQVDSLAHDLAATVARARDFYADFPARVDVEAELIRTLDPVAVVADIPPIAFPAAARAGIPGIALANFTWDWIYEAYDEFRVDAAAALATIRAAYASATLALRLPFPGGFEPMSAVTRDIPLIGRRSRLGRDAARGALGLDAERPIVLASFGGHGTALSFERIARENNITLVLTGYETGPVTSSSSQRLRWLGTDDFVRCGLRYEDLVAAADLVVTKPGYGIVSECIVNGTALLYTSRGHFIEQDVFLSAMPRVLRCRFIDQEALRAGRWGESISALLDQAEPPERMNANGAAVAADLILEAIRR